MPTPSRRTLNIGGSVSLATVAGVVTGTVTLGPEFSPGPANWRIDGVIIQTNRPGVAPIPRAQVYLDLIAPANSQGITYDGSFSQGSCDINLSRGGRLLVQWIGGTVGDLASVTITGEKW
jgi:hypothetical protein